LKMDSSTESSERQSASMNHSGSASEKQASDSQDYSYEDDFEEPDSSSKDKSQDSSGGTVTPTVTITSTDDSTKTHTGDSDHSTTTTAESKSEQDGGQHETGAGDQESMQKPSRPPYDDPSDDSEPEPEGDSYMFTDDQHRAMMELMAQKHDSGDYSDDPPEYNVKERLKELNAELAKEPDPDENDRSHRVGFKPELVDLVAPPPEVSDEEDSARKTPTEDSQKNSSPAGARGASGDGKNNFVVERDGKFDVVAAQDLTTSERAMFNIQDEDTDRGPAVGSSGDSGDRKANNVNNSNSRQNKENVQPAPPSKPRPATANGYSRRTVRTSSSPRPQTAQPNHSSTLQDFNYKSPYAMSPEEKERAAERAWLRRKREEDKQRRHEEEERKKREAKDDRAKENEEAYKGWLKTKQSQVQREKLLKKREEQEMKDGYYVRSREECDKAYKEWLKQKYAEIRRQRAAERQRVKAFRSQARRTRKQQMMARALRQSQAFRYVDYYGYRF
ncbi:hypothetical protein BaRGS_00005690, partial [Batillaria attramentaria]